MPINHWLSSPYMMEASSKTPPPTAVGFWAAPAAACGLNLNSEGIDEAVADVGPKEPLFEKPLTPSDVGKLNRLVIPKQHAERHFPLNGGGGGEKGLLLGFEDEAGKSWRFRYSYWNSSQSYVLTKGWSRFVKEKRLDAGDIVLFARHPKDAGRLFIGWRRRSGGGGGQEGGVPRQPCGGGGGWSGLVYAAHTYPTHSSNSVLYQTHCPHAESDTREKNGNSKRLRLFGVNLEWDDDESEASTPKVSSQARSDEEHYSSNGRAVSYVCDSSANDI